MANNAAVVRAYVDAVSQFDEAAMTALLHPDMRFHELPNRIRPKGGVDDLAAMIDGLRRAREGKVLRGQRYIFHDVIAADDRVVVEARWEGELAVPIGRLQAGEIMVAHICMVFRLLGGQIVEQRNYDCYEDFNVTP